MSRSLELIPKSNGAYSFFPKVYLLIGDSFVEENWERRWSCIGGRRRMCRIMSSLKRGGYCLLFMFFFLKLRMSGGGGDSFISLPPRTHLLSSWTLRFLKKKLYSHLFFLGVLLSSNLTDLFVIHCIG
jgi:hypothetical protein